MTKDEALKLALEALDSKYIVGCGAWREQQIKAITTIKEALAQPAQEPVHNVTSNGRYSPLLTHMMNKRTAPQQQEPRNFCPRCGKRTADLTVIHTCTPPEGGHQ